MFATLTPRVRLLLTFTLSLLAVLVALRLGFMAYFLGHHLEKYPAAVLKALGIGVRFDLRITLLAMLPLAVLSFLPGPLRLRDRRWVQAIAVLYGTLLSVFLALFYIADFAHFSYLGERLNVTVLEFMKDQRDSLAMVWQTYPVLRLLLAVAVAGYLGYRAMRALICRYATASWPARRWQGRVVVTAVCVALFCVGILGKVTSVVPLRWSNAFFSGDLQIAALGLNPVAYFFETQANQGQRYDLEAVRAHYPQVAEYLGVTEPDLATLNFSRQVAGRDSTRRPNVVFIHLESLGANRMGLYGNPYGATPYIDQIARESSYFFPRFMVPASGTARTVFGLVTGIPDVTWGGSTASRNPLIIDQYTLVNAFEDYHKLYLIGGDAGWANIRGLLQHNIDALELWEQSDYNVPTVDVWGISDRDLFKQAHARANALAEEGKPFVMFVQTAGNHRPYTIPKDDADFQVETPPMEELSKYTWQDHAQYNAARLLDYNIRFYLEELVKGSAYENNTLFVMYGDHNTRGTFGQHMGWSENLALNDYHVPALIHGPGVIDGAHELPVNASLPDLMPTVLSLIGLPYENRTLGRDLLSIDPQWDYNTIFGGNRTVAPTIGLTGPDHSLQMDYNGENLRLYRLDEPSLDAEMSQQDPAKAAEMKFLLEGLQETFRYIMFHNSK